MKKGVKKKLTGLWRKENEYGEYFTGTIDGQVVILSPNKKREGFNEKTGKEHNDADFQLFMIVDQE